MACQVPSGTAPEVAQRVLDDLLYTNAGQRKKRAYDNTRLAQYFEEGQAVWNRLMRDCRLYFFRYFSISDEAIPDLIKTAALIPLEPDSDQYTALYKKVLEWRKNWFYNFARAAGIVQRRLERDNLGLTLLPKENLVEAYSQKFSFERLYAMVQDINCSTVDWRATLRSPAADTLYRTIFGYTM